MNGGLKKVVIVGTTDVDARIELMQCLCSGFELSAIGSTEEQRVRFEDAGLAYRVCPLSRGVNPIRDWIAYRGFVQALRELRPDVVHAFDTKPCVWARLAARAVGVPCVIGTITGLGALYATPGMAARLTRTIYEPLQRRACHRSNMTVFYNRDDADQFADAGIVPRDRTAIVPGSGVRTDRFSRDQVAFDELSRVREDAGLREGEFVVTMVVRVCRSKGVMEFAAAADRLRQEVKQVRFLLVGPEDRGAWDHLDDSQLDVVRRSVTWLGKRDDIAAVLAASNVCVLPTFYREGIPRVLVEAASMGLPLIATDVPGCRDVVRPGVNGLLVPGQDPESLAQAIARLAGNEAEARAFGQASRQIAVNEFDITAVAREIGAIYRACVGE